MKFFYAGFKFFLLLTVAVLLSASLSAQDEAKLFIFKYQKDDTYRILSKIEEDVFVNNIKDHHSEILNRISVRVTAVDAKGCGTHEASFMTSDEAESAASGKHFTWNNQYKSVYIQNPQGIFTIDNQYFMPVVRNMPVFSEKAVKPGDSWTATGYEAHDLRQTFNLQTPFIVPFTATYTYTGTEKSNNGKTFDVFNANYSLYYENPAPRIHSGQAYSDYPVSTMGYSNRTIYWDTMKNGIDHYDETFRINIVTSYGNVYKFAGTAHSEITEFKRTATEENVRKLQSIVKKMDITDISVTAGDKGLMLSMDNIQFESDSADLMESEKLKLQKLSSIFRQYPDNDLLISGHTALAGTEEACQALSEKRARAVADYLIQLGVKDAYHIFTEGRGAKDPVAPNTTEEGRSKNRRVEITILDK